MFIAVAFGASSNSLRHNGDRFKFLLSSLSSLSLNTLAPFVHLFNKHLNCICALFFADFALCPSISASPPPPPCHWGSYLVSSFSGRAHADPYWSCDCSQPAGRIYWHCYPISLGPGRRVRCLQRGTGAEARQVLPVWLLPRRPPPRIAPIKTRAETIVLPIRR